MANDGTAYGIGTHLDIDPAVRERVRVILRRSLELPYDRIGNNGRSTGTLQQVSDEAVDALTPGQSYGWGSMAETMNPAASALRFVAQVQVTADPVYVAKDGTVRLSDPIAADVLRAQQPLISEARSSNYSAAKVALAKRMARGGSRFWTDGGA